MYVLATVPELLLSQTEQIGEFLLISDRYMAAHFLKCALNTLRPIEMRSFGVIKTEVIILKHGGGSIMSESNKKDLYSLTLR